MGARVSQRVGCGALLVAFATGTRFPVEWAPFLPPAMRVTHFTSHAETCARACAIALGFSIPISVVLDNVLLALILACSMVAGRYQEKLRRIACNQVALAAFALFALLVAGLAYGTREPGDGLRYLGKYVDLAFVPIFLTLFDSERVRRLAWHALGAGIALTLLLSFAIWLGLAPEHWALTGDRRNPVVFKQYLTQGLMMAFGALMFAQLARTTPSRPQRYGWSLLAALAAVNVILLTPGRTGQLILAALVIHFVHSLWRWRGTFVATAGITIALCALVLGTTGTGARFERAINELKDWQPAKAVTTDSSIGNRLEFYHSSLEIAREHPLIGTGTGSFPKVYADHVAGTAMTPTTNPHNEYLNIVIQLGAVGLLTMLYLFHCAWRLAPALPTSLERGLARGLVITFVVGSLFNSLLMDHAEGLLFAWATGLLFAGLNSPPATTAERAA